MKNSIISRNTDSIDSRLIDVDRINKDLREGNRYIKGIDREVLKEFSQISQGKFFPVEIPQDRIPVNQGLVYDQSNNEVMLAWFEDYNKDKVARIWAVYNTLDHEVIFPITRHNISSGKKLDTNQDSERKVLFIDPKVYDPTKNPMMYRGLRLVHQITKENGISSFYDAFVVNDKNALVSLDGLNAYESKFTDEIIQNILDNDITDIAMPAQRNYLSRTYNISKKIKAVLPHIKITWGGPIITELAGSFYTNSPFHPLNWAQDQEGIPIFDHLVVGEAENTIVEHFQNQSILPVKGVSSYDTKTGDFYIAPPREFTEPSNIPFIKKDDFQFLSDESQKRMKAFENENEILEGARGCPHSCNFCPGPAIRQISNPYNLNEVNDKGKRISRWNQRDPELFVDEIEKLVDQGITNILIGDNTFTANKGWVEKLAQEITHRNIQASLSVYSRFDDFYKNNEVDYELISNLKSIGVNIISLGFESGSDDILSDIKKNSKVNIDDYESILRSIKENGIESRLTAIIGLDNEIIDDAERTCERLKEYAEKSLVSYLDMHNVTVLEHHNRHFNSDDVQKYLNLECSDLPLDIFIEELTKKGQEYFRQNIYSDDSIYLRHHFFNDCSVLGVPLEIFPKDLKYGNSELTLFDMAKLVYEINSEYAVSKTNEVEAKLYSSRSGN